MLGRRLLTRLTRLGLATYAMTYAMTFTVCASENPVADIIVADTASMIVESSDTGSDTGILTQGDAGIVTADDPADENVIVGNEENDIIITDEEPAVSDEIITELTEDAVADEDMVIGTYEDEGYMEADGAGGVGLRGGPAINIVKELQINDGDNISIDQREDFRYSITAMRTTESGVSWETDVTNLTTKGTLSWGLYDVNGFDDEIINATSINSMPQELHGITVTKVPGSVDVVVSFENADPRAKVYLVAAYKEHENVSYVAIGKCLVDVKITGTVEDLEAHLTQKSLKIEVYKKNNVLPVTIRMSDAGRSGETPDFNITEVSFDSKYSMLNNYFNISVNPVNEEKCNLVIIANEDAINDDSVVDMFKSYKKGISTNLNLNVTDGKNSTILTTLEKVTFTFGDEKPTAKTVKAGTTLTFDSWFSNNSWSPYDIDELNITGANVGWMAIPDVAKDAKAWANLGLAIRYYDGEEIIYSTPNMLKKGSGKINLVVGIEDSSYNLPDNYNITIPVSYSITDSTPTLKPDKTTVNINKDAGDRVPINFTYSGSRNYNTKIEVTDSTGKKVYNEANTPINYTSSRDYSGNLILTLYPTGKAERNNNYKVKVTAKSPYNSKKVSATKVITVKVLKAGAQMSISSVSAKGSIDASLSNSYIYLTFTGKNVDLDWRTATCNITLKDKTKKDITSEYFGAGAYYDSYGKTVGYIRCYSGAKLLKDGYAGKKATATFTFDVEGTQLNKTYDFTIGNSKVTPKLCTDKVTLNPVYDNSTNVTFYLKNEFANNYKYNVTILDKNKKSADDLFDVTMDISSSPVYIKVTPKNISKLAGQTYTMKITPYWEYDGELVPLKTGTATATIAVLKKPDVTISAKTNGSIDVVRDNTCVGIDLTYKNMYIDPYHAFDNATINITDSKGNDVTNKFDWEIYSPYYGYIYRGEGVDNITAGTYKATIKLISEEYPSVETTASFKVTRGSTGTKLNPKSVTLVNRDYSRSYIVNIDRASDVNQITNVTLGDAFKDVFVLSKHGSMDKWRVKVKYGYVERTNKGVPITKAVKKTVPINVYYNGSLKPDTVKLTVTIEP